MNLRGGMKRSPDADSRTVNTIQGAKTPDPPDSEDLP